MAKGSKPISKKKAPKKPVKKPIKQEPDELNDQVIRFCEHYLVHFNGAKAAVQAGYSEKTAAQQASRLLTKVKVQEYLQARKEKIAEKLHYSQERTMLEIARVSFGDIRKLFTVDGALKPITELDDDTAALISSVEVCEEEVTARDIESDEKIVAGTTKKVKLWDKMKGLEMLAKHYKIFDDGPKVTNNINLGKLNTNDLKTLLALQQKAGT
jgi:phage terminase small subunit